MILLERGRLICPYSNLDKIGDVCIVDGIISSLPAVLPADVQRVNCEGKIIVPGFVDLLAFCGHPSQLHRETPASLSLAAAAGGYAAVACGPVGGDIYDTPSIIREFCSLSKSVRGAVIHAIGALSMKLEGRSITEMGLLKQAGAAALFQSPMKDSSVLRRILQYARPHQCPVIIRPADLFLEELGVMHEGLVSTRVGLRGIPAAAEQIGVSTILNLVEATDCPVHLSHVTTAQSIELIARAKSMGLPITAGTTARHLLLTDTLVEQSRYDTRAHLLPPLRPESDRIAMIQALKEGVLDCVISDHQPCTKVEKECEFSLSVPGAMGVETAASAAYTALVDPMIWAKVLTQTAGAIIDKKPSLCIGAPANVVVFDPTIKWIPNGSYISKGCNEPLEGYSLQGRVIFTFIKGKWIYHHGKDKVNC